MIGGTSYTGGASAITGPLEPVAAPGGRIVTLLQAARQCKFLDPDADTNTYLGELIDRATVFCEQEIYGHRQILPATYDLPLCEFPLDVLSMPRPPLQAVSSVSYYDLNNTLTTLATSLYNVRTPWRQPGRIERAPYQIWPVAFADRPYPITVRFIAGYLSPVTASASTDALTSTGRAFTDTQRVKVWNIGGALPAPLTAFTDYWVVSASGQTLQLATAPGGNAINLTDAGTGLNYVGDFPENIKQAVLMLVAFMHENRGDTPSQGDNELLAVERLLKSECYGSYA